MEIERKYLISKLPENLGSFKSERISQSYLSYEPEIRIRQKGSFYYLTIKSEGDAFRKEVELPLTVSDYNVLKAMSIDGSEVLKKRYFIELKDWLFELDIYDKEEFMTVEVEFENEDAFNSFKGNEPNWFGKEITYDPSYKNKNISKRNSLNI